MNEMIDLLNELSEKYKFDDADKKRCQECIFKIESGDNELYKEGEDFVSPEGVAVEEVETEED